MEYINLLGTEDVQRAGRNMISAAETMNRATAYLENIFQRHERFMDDWLERFTEAMKDPEPPKQGF